MSVVQRGKKKFFVECVFWQKIIQKVKKNRIIHCASTAGLSWILLIATSTAYATSNTLKGSLLPTDQPREEIQQILEHYPAGAIHSVAKADEILDVVDQAKKNIDARLYNEKLICNDKFLVYACYDEAEARKRVDLRALTMLEVEAKRYKRFDDIRQSDLQRDINEMDEIADAPDRYESIKAHENKLKQIQEKEKERELAARGITDSPQKKHQGNLMTPQEKERNVQNYEQKQKDKQKHLKDVESKKAKTEKHRQNAVKRKEEEAKRKEELRKARERAEKRRRSF